MEIVGKCCASCATFDRKECPVKNADPWSRWKDYCSNYERGRNQYIDSASLGREMDKKLDTFIMKYGTFAKVIILSECFGILGIEKYRTVNIVYSCSVDEVKVF
jgi:hypothetical protein